MLKGYDCFFLTPGMFDKKTCKVCGSTCDVQKDVTGYTGFASAMSKKMTIHDQFVCPHVQEEWHKKTLKLIQDIEECNSPTIKKIMQTDLKTIIGTK